MLLQHRSFIWKVSWKLKTGMHRKSPVLRITLELDLAFSPARNSYTNATRSARCLDPPANLQICDRKGEDELGNQCRGRILTSHRALARIRCPWWENRVREQSSSPWSSQPLWNHLRDRHRYHREVATIVTNKWGRLTSRPLLYVTRYVSGNPWPPNPPGTLPSVESDLIVARRRGRRGGFCWGRAATRLGRWGLGVATVPAGRGEVAVVVSPAGWMCGGWRGDGEGGREGERTRRVEDFSFFVESGGEGGEVGVIGSVGQGKDTYIIFAPPQACWLNQHMFFNRFLMILVSL